MRERTYCRAGRVLCTRRLLGTPYSPQKSEIPREIIIIEPREPKAARASDGDRVFGQNMTAWLFRCSCLCMAAASAGPMSSYGSSCALLPGRCLPTCRPCSGSCCLKVLGLVLVWSSLSLPPNALAWHCIDWCFGPPQKAPQSDMRALFSKGASLAVDAAAGVAFGLASTMSSVSPVLDLSFSRATLYTPSCPRASLFWV